MTESINKKLKYKILSIDGGGTKALYSMYILDKFERKFCIPEGKLLADYFQMVCGTSAGSMVATAISLKIPMSVLINIFESNVDKIFPSGSNSYIWSAFEYIYNGINQLTGDKYKTNPLKEVLEELYKEKTMKDLHIKLCIPAFCVSKSQIHVFNNLEDCQDIKLVDIVLASAAAPTYFKPHQIGDDYYIDGGVWANDPSFVGIINALQHYVGQGKEYVSYSLLSIGNLTEKLNYKIDNPASFFNIANIPTLISFMISANISSSEYYINKMDFNKFGDSLRIEHEESENYQLDDSNQSFLELLKKWSEQDYETNKEFVKIFLIL
jgi:patatin-like phospholipase/acyl hydrolase